MNIVDIITNNGMGVACLLFMFYLVKTYTKDSNAALSQFNLTLDKMCGTLVSICNTLENLTDRVENIEDKLKEGKSNESNLK